MSWHSHDDQNHKQLYWDTVSGDAFRLWYGLVGECVSLRQWDGVLPRYVAMCATPGLLPRFEELLAELTKIPDLVEDRGGEIELMQISQHIPPPGQRPEVMAPRKRANLEDHWRRKCERGDHNSHCPPQTCPVKLARAQARKSKRQPVSTSVADHVEQTETGRQPVPSGTGTGSGRDVTSTPKPSMEEEAPPLPWKACVVCWSMDECKCFDEEEQ